MEAKLISELPTSDGWQYEPKWDGFRVLVLKDGSHVELKSKSGKPLTRYFPELEAQVRQLKAATLILDGEIILPLDDVLSFDALQQRLHPAASRIARLSRETPARLMLFDALRIGDEELISRHLSERRAALESWYHAEKPKNIDLSPVTLDMDKAKGWLARSGGALDGIMAKRRDEAYQPGIRAMFKLKTLRTADCVVGGYRKTDDGGVASLLLGLFNDEGTLDHVGFTSAIAASERSVLAARLDKIAGGPGFTGKAPGGPSRWTRDRSADWTPLRTCLVVEVQYDQVTGDRFRHGARLLRWRPDKDPRQCTFEQLKHALKPAEIDALL